MSAKLISINVSGPKEIVYKGQTIVTGIFKEPVKGPVRLRTLNLDGDRQADLKVHGGIDKAVYAYPLEHYEYWRRELPEIAFGYGQFGENFTTEGLLEREICIGDRFQIGSAEVMVTQPRMPCFKLAAKFQRDDMIKRFLFSGRSGFYFSVLKEGTVEENDNISLLEKQPDSVAVSDVVKIYLDPVLYRDLLIRVIRVPALPESWREHFIRALEK